MKDTRSNFSITAIAVFIAATTCLLLSAFIEARNTAGILRTTGIVFLCVMIIQVVVFSVKPVSFKNRKEKK